MDRSALHPLYVCGRSLVVMKRSWEGKGRNQDAINLFCIRDTSYRLWIRFYVSSRCSHFICFPLPYSHASCSSAQCSSCGPLVRRRLVVSVGCPRRSHVSRSRYTSVLSLALTSFLAQSLDRDGVTLRQQGQRVGHHNTPGKTASGFLQVFGEPGIDRTASRPNRAMPLKPAARLSSVPMKSLAQEWRSHISQRGMTGCRDRTRASGMPGGREMLASGGISDVSFDLRCGDVAVPIRLPLAIPVTANVWRPRESLRCPLKVV